MKKSLYTKTIKEIAKWTGDKAKEVDTSNFRYPKDIEHKFKNRDSFVICNYNQSEDDETLKRVADRSMSFYLRENNKDIAIDRSVHIYENESHMSYTHRAMIDVRVNNKCVAYFTKDIDLYDYDGKVANNIGDIICGLIFRP